MHSELKIKLIATDQLTFKLYKDDTIWKYYITPYERKDSIQENIVERINTQINGIKQRRDK